MYDFQEYRIPVKGFMDRLIREFRSPTTARNYKFSCLRFCRFLIVNGLDSFEKVTISHIRLFSLTDEHATPQIQKIHEYRKTEATPMELRTAAIVTVGLELGFRASDVIRLKLKDIDWKNRKVFIIQ